MRFRRASLVKLLAPITLMLVGSIAVTWWITRLPFSARKPASLPGASPSRLNSSKLLCFVLAQPDRAAASVSIKDTWGSRCDTLLFFSARPVPGVDSVVVRDTVDGYSRLWGHVRRIWAHVARSMQHVQRHDWFLKADDDTYVIVENLRRFLDEQTVGGAPVWYGAKLKNPKVKSGYNSGGAGYVLNRRALQLFANGSVCNQMDFGYEDLELGRCLERIGVATGDTRDPVGRPTFLPFPPEDLLSRPTNGVPGALANNASWYWKSVWWPHSLGRNCCSRRAISFHKVTPKMMYAMDYLIYSLTTSGDE